MDPRPKLPKRVKLNLTLAADVVEALETLSLATAVPRGRIVDDALRVKLGLADPRKGPGAVKP